jgi:hypothetical protein
MKAARKSDEKAVSHSEFDALKRPQKPDDSKP